MSRTVDILSRTVLLPLLAAQGLHVRRKALILPEAEGPRAGIDGTGPDLHLLVLGDSSAAGVGVARQQDALSGQLAAALNPHFRLHWRLEARTGETTRSTLARMRDIRPMRTDAVVLALGVNDTTRLAAPGGWLRRQQALYDLLRRDCGAQQIYVTAVPPLGQFPLLPQPLRWVLGRHARGLDLHLQRLLADQPDCTHISLDLPPDPALMADDGFHPGARVYRHWARLVATRIRQDFAPSAGTNTVGGSHLQSPDAPAQSPDAPE